MNKMDGLRQLRDKLGLTRRELGERIGVSKKSIEYFEYKGYDKAHKSSSQRIINDFLNGVHAVNDENGFIKGHRYRIWASGKSEGEPDDMKPETGRGCIFVYLRKEGRHHMFKEERGGWLRTYTDIQLKGKKIKEVEASS